MKALELEMSERPAHSPVWEVKMVTLHVSALPFYQGTKLELMSLKAPVLPTKAHVVGVLSSCIGSQDTKTIHNS